MANVNSVRMDSVYIVGGWWVANVNSVIKRCFRWYVIDTVQSCVY